MPEVTTVRFDGDNLQTVREGERVWVVVKRVCEALGVDPNGQQQRLRDGDRCAWATTCMTHAVLEDGRNYEMFCVDLDTLPMWLATIDVGRVRPEAREKLIAYQRECARVLRDHFFGSRGSHSSAEETQRAILSIVEPLVDTVLTKVSAQIAGIDARTREITDRVRYLEEQVLFGAVITPTRARSLKAEVKSVATLQVLVGARPSMKVATSTLYADMAAAAGWGSSGQPWGSLPLSKLQAATDVLARHRKEAEGLVQTVVQARLNFEGTQQKPIKH